MKVIDMHLHLNTKLESAAASVKEMQEQMRQAGVERGLLLHLNSDRFDFRDAGAALKGQDQIKAFVGIDPYQKNAIDCLIEAVTEYGFVGLKLHPRLDGYNLNDPIVLNMARKCREMQIPICMDAFPDGYSLQRGFAIGQLAEVARALGDVPLIVGHMGGIYCLEMMLLAKRVPNIFMNIAYTLLYFRGSSVTQDLLYSVRSLKGKRVFYGSDFPDRSIPETLQLSLAEFERFGLEKEFQQSVLFDNADEFWSEWF